MSKPGSHIIPLLIVVSLVTIGAYIFTENKEITIWYLVVPLVIYVLVGVFFFLDNKKDESN